MKRIIFKRITFILLLITLITPHVFADMDPSTRQPISGSANLIYPVDLFDGDGILDTAIIGTDSNAIAVGDASWNIKVSNVYDVSSVDLDSDGRLDEVIIAGRDIVAADSGGELWRINDTNGYSVASADLDGDGKVDEFVVGTGKKIMAFDGSGASIWNYTDVEQETLDALYLAIIEKRIVFGKKGSSVIIFLNYDGDYTSSATASGIITGMTAFDLKQKGNLNGVAVESFDGNVKAFDSNGQLDWINEGKKIDAADDRLSKSLMFAMDRDSKGTLDYILFNQDRYVYWISSKGTGGGNPYIDSAISPADFDGDGIYDDIVISREWKSDGKGEIRAFNAKFKKLGELNDTGASSIIVLGSGMDSKIIAINDNFRTISTIYVEVEDSTTATTTTTTSTTTSTTTPTTSGTAATTTTTTTQPQPQTTDKVISVIPDQETKIDLSKIDEVAPDPSILSDSGTSFYQWFKGDKLLAESKNLVLQDLGDSLQEGINQFNFTVLNPEEGKKSYNMILNIVVSAAGADGGANGAIDSDADGLTDEQEKVFRTNPYNADTDGDGIIDSEDANPLVADEKGILPSSNGSGIFKVLKWAVIIIVLFVAIIFVREKVKDFLWERQRDWLD